MRFQAISQLEASNPGLVVSVTIPVLPSGPDSNGDAFLQEAKANGTRIDVIGQNDDPAEVFTEANAQTLESFAQQNHLGRLAFWSVDRDQACGGGASGLPQCSEISQQPLDFTKIVTKYTG